MLFLKVVNQCVLVMNNPKQTILLNKRGACHIHGYLFLGV